MFQLKVPTWGSSTTPKTFEVVEGSSESQNKKRPATTPAAPSGTKGNEHGPKTKKSKKKEVDATAVHMTATPKALDKPAKGAPKSVTNSTAPNSSPKPKIPAKQTSVSSPTPIKSSKSAQAPKGQVQGAKSEPKGKSQKPAQRDSKHDSKNKKDGKKKNQKNRKARPDSESEDSLDELFGSYGDSNSEFSYTSGEDDMEIIIRSPNESRDSASLGSDDESSDGEPLPKKGEEFSSDGFSSEDDEPVASSSAPVRAPKLSALQEQMKAKLEGGRFRFINQKLYTTTGEEAFELFQQEPVLFDVYHQGYRNQVEKWPQNPLDLIIGYLKKQPASLVVADFGCGEARLAQTVPQKTVHSFDLVARNKFITACDIAHVPLKDSSVDVAVFCLSLMGNNVSDFLREALRVLKPKGILKIAEVKSRFEKITTFTEGLEKLGFEVQKRDDSNKMFILFDCIKTDRKPAKEVSVKLKPCIYKRR